MTGGQSAGDTDRCGYCDGTELVYKLSVSGGSKYRCIECLAIERGQTQFRIPFETWIDRDDVEPPEYPGAPDIESYDPREKDYERAKAWFRVLARLKDDEPIIKRDPDAIRAVHADIRAFLTGVMGEEAHERPSELRSTTPGAQEADGDD
jgi:hypothetical protein